MLETETGEFQFHMEILKLDIWQHLTHLTPHQMEKNCSLWIEAVLSNTKLLDNVPPPSWQKKTFVIFGSKQH